MTSETPGLVCAHHHLHRSLARGIPAPTRTPTTFVEVLERTWWRLDRALDLELVRWSALLGALEALEAGTTGIIDLHSSPEAIEGSLDVVADACAEVGVRVRCAYEVTDRNGLDGAKAGLAENERYLRAGGDGFVGAHACFTMSDDTLDAVTDLAADLGVGVHLHVAEAEVDAGAASRLLVHADQSWLLAHAVHLERPLPGIVVHNPRSNLDHAVGYARPARFERVALGTDGISADMLEEFRLAFALARARDLQFAAERRVEVARRGPAARAGHRVRQGHVEHGGDDARTACVHPGGATGARRGRRPGGARRIGTDPCRRGRDPGASRRGDETTVHEDGRAVTTTIGYDEYLRRLPKVELHCHVEGTLRPATVADLARKHDITLPTSDVDHIYDYATIYEFLEIFRFVNSTVIDRDDFARVAYESLEDGVKLGNLKYREMFFNPTLHTTRGVPMATIVDGLIDGTRAAEADFGVRCFLIADVYRQDPVADGDADDRGGRRARTRRGDRPRHGRRRGARPARAVRRGASRSPPTPGCTSPATRRRTRPPVNITTCLDVLGCERIDHGYHILADDAVVERCRDDGIHFTCCPTSTAMVYGWPDLTTHPINGMLEAGLLVHLNSDDPTMFRTDIGKEYVDFVGQNDYPPEVAKAMVLNGVDATWLDPSDKATLRAAFEAELAVLDAELADAARSAAMMAS